MKIGIIVAMEKEMRLLLPLLEDRTDIEAEGRNITSGRIGTHRVYVMQCGIGKVNAALVTSVLLRCVSPDLVINTGVAGGADSSMHVLDMLVADAVTYHDVWCGPGTEWGAAAGCPVVLPTDAHVVKTACDLFQAEENFHVGLICSGDIFVSKAEETARIKLLFPKALAVDMESGAIAQVCFMSGIPFSIIRVISDTPGQAENISQYENFWIDAPRETFAMLKQIINQL